nr:carbohydrate ABC transporter permease [Candidatus Entotheonella palauensis]
MASNATEAALGTYVKDKTPLWRVRQAIVTYTSLIPYIAFSLFPFYIMLITSLKSKQEINNLGKSPFWATGVAIENYKYLATNTRFFDAWMLNTIIVSLAATAISVVIGGLAAYALARLRFRGVEAFGVAVFVSYLVPQSLLFLPMIEIVNFIDDFIPIRDSYFSLILTYPTFLIPFVTWLLMGYFRTIPFEIEECAYVDGASRIRTVISIVIPMAMPGIATAILFAFTLSWNEFLYSLVFIQDELQKNLVGGRGDRTHSGRYLFLGLSDGRVSHRLDPDFNSVRIFHGLFRFRSHRRSDQIEVIVHAHSGSLQSAVEHGTGLEHLSSCVVSDDRTHAEPPTSARALFCRSQCSVWPAS